ncbi:MAG TPA: hypothetical protein VFB99_07860, partial [Vicinamibacterales bacterium]|nr:hypothetical protein [Vicinamibacterales bacterium]
TATRQPLYGQVGFYCRPDPADTTGYAEYLGLDTEDGKLPIAGRDLRLNSKVNPKDGEVGAVQYGGGFISLAHNADAAGTTTVIYAPKLSGGSVEKAHAITLDTSTSNLSVSIVHANGMAVLLTQQDKLVLRNKDGTQLITLDTSELVISGVIKLFGGVVAGDTSTAQPVALYGTLAAFVAALYQAGVPPTGYAQAVNNALTALLVPLEGVGGPLKVILDAQLANLATAAANASNPALGASQTLKASPI